MLEKNTLNHTKYTHSNTKPNTEYKTFYERQQNSLTSAPAWLLGQREYIKRHHCVSGPSPSPPGDSG